MHLRVQLRKLADVKLGDLIGVRRDLENQRDDAGGRLQQIAGPDAMPWLRHVERIDRDITALAAPIEAAQREQQAAARAEKLASTWRNETRLEVERDDERRTLEEIAERAGWPRGARLG